MAHNSNLGPMFVAWEGKKIIVMDESKRNTFYIADSHPETKQLIFHTPNGSEQVAAITYAPDGTSINISMNGATVEIKPKDWKGTEWSYQSPMFLNAYGGTSRITWEGMVSMMCTNENGMAIAKFKAAKLSLHRIGTIEFMDENISQQAKDEIVVTGTAIMAITAHTKVMGTPSTTNITLSYLVTNAAIQASNS